MKPKTLSWFFIVLTAACIDPYQLEVIPTGEDYLVIDGFINSGEGPTTFTLSHLMNLDAEGNGRPELNAQVNVESDAGETFLLPEVEDGKYSLEHPVEASKQYRVRIQTADDKEYLSDFTEVKHTPPIDSVTWAVDNENKELDIFVTTHDPAREARYYQWDYEETYHFKSDYETKWEYRNGVFVYDETIEIHDCWKTNQSTRLLTASTSQLAEDVVYKFPVTVVTPESDKLKYLYSILMKQYTLTQDAYLYVEQLKKYTELSGSIFDPVPARIAGNIRCISHPDEPAIGYVSAYNVETQRIFLSDDQLPAWFYIIKVECPEDVKRGGGPTFGLTVQHVKSGYALPAGTSPIAYSLEMKTCVDCRFDRAPHNGGMNVKPDFWPK